MDAIEAIHNRRSIRKYREDPVPFELIGNILDAGLAAPSAGNLQDWYFIFVTESDIRKKIAEACVQQYWMQDAPVHIVVCCQPNRVKKFYGEKGEKTYSVQDCAAAIENMLIAATAQGLGSCWIGAMNEEMMRNEMGIPPNVNVQGVITIGYAGETPESPIKNAMENKVFVERWGGKLRDRASYMGYYSEHVEKAVKKGKEMFKEAMKKVREKSR